MSIATKLGVKNYFFQLTKMFTKICKWLFMHQQTTFKRRNIIARRVSCCKQEKKLTLKQRSRQYFWLIKQRFEATVMNKNPLNQKYDCLNLCQVFDYKLTQRFSNWGSWPFLGSPNIILGSPKSTQSGLLS